MADTGHEHPMTYDWVAALPERTGGPAVEMVRADFSHQIERKRAYVAEHWARKGVAVEDVDRALAALVPTGNPFLDLCIWKGRFPSSGARFCTEELKVGPIEGQVIGPALDLGPVIRWQGERAEESPRRAKLPRVQAVRGWAHRLTIFRPILRWTAAQVFDLHRAHGLVPNPLYRLGMGRVGCMPCIMARKGELAQIVARFPDVLDRLREWEEIVGRASKRGAATFFGPDRTPEGRAMAKAGVAGGVDGFYPDARAVFDAARTSRGGVQYDWITDLDASAACSSQYGLCE